jgi:hypothetical protein
VSLKIRLQIQSRYLHQVFCVRASKLNKCGTAGCFSESFLLLWLIEMRYLRRTCAPARATGQQTNRKLGQMQRERDAFFACSRRKGKNIKNKTFLPRDLTYILINIYSAAASWALLVETRCVMICMRSVETERRGRSSRYRGRPQGNTRLAAERDMMRNARE